MFQIVNRRGCRYSGADLGIARHADAEGTGLRSSIHFTSRRNTVATRQSRRKPPEITLPGVGGEAHEEIVVPTPKP